jgi:DNA topoisomerase-1
VPQGRRARATSDPEDAAASAGLRYVTDAAPGLGRRRTGDKSFTYHTASGRPVKDKATLDRIRALAIPPAWTDVWICADPRGHIQAVGRDAKGRKQYRYHPRWREVRDDAKYGRMIAFGKALPAVRARTDRDLRRQGLPRDKVLATVVRLLERTLIRVGNEEYARTNRSFGLTTLRDHHVDVRGPRLRFRFRGKSGKMHEVGLEDRRLSTIVKRCQDIPGQELFQYIDLKGRRHSVESEDVNRYLREITGRDFTAKDFRTWAGTMRAAWALHAVAAAAGPQHKATKTHVVRAVESVARRLGNTPSICRKCYIHPAIIDSYLDGSLRGTLTRRAAREIAAPAGKLRPEEAAVLRLLARRAAALASGVDLGLTLRASLRAARRSHAGVQ